MKTAERGGRDHAGARSFFGRVSPLMLILGVAFLVKLIVLLQLHAHPLLQPRGELDSGTYLELARRVAAGDLLAGDRVFFVSPFYVYFVALVLALSGVSVVAVQTAQIVLGTAAVWLIALTARRLYGEPASWIAAALATLTGYFTFNEILVLQSAVDPLLTALGLWLLARAWLDGRARTFVTAGLVLGLHVLNRPNMAAWAAAAVLLTLVGPRVIRVARPPLQGRQIGRAAGLRPAAMLVCGLVIALTPVALRNYGVAHEMALVSSHGGLNFYIGNNAFADGTYHMVSGITPSIAGQDRDMRRVAQAAAGRTLSDTDASTWFYVQAWTWIRTHTRDTVRLFAKKILYVFNATDLPLNFSFAYYSGDESTLLRVLFVGPWLLLPLGLAGLWLGRPGQQARETERATWRRWGAFIPVYSVSVALFFVAGRYRLPLLVALSVTSAGTLRALWKRWRAARWMRLAAALALVAVLGIVTNLDLGLDNGLAGERTEMILHDIDTRQDMAAAALLARTEPMHPERALLLFRVGRAYVERGDAALAIRHLERALAIEPNRPEVRLTLGQALLDLGRASEAVPHLRAALQARVRPDLAAFDLARALAATADRTGALAALRALPSLEGLDPASQLGSGQLALELGDAGLAESFLARAVTGAPNNAAARESLGVALGMLGRRAEAIAALERACQLGPSNPTAPLNLAVMYAESGRLGEARQRAQEALRLKPDYTRARDLLAALDRTR